MDTGPWDNMAPAPINARIIKDRAAATTLPNMLPVLFIKMVGRVACYWPMGKIRLAGLGRKWKQHPGREWGLHDIQYRNIGLPNA